MADAPSRNPDERELLANVGRTLDTAIQVLTHLEQTLVRAGFARGAGAYRSMCDVLLGQRLWSLSRADDRLRHSFKDVAAHAAAVHRILHPYTETMQRLSALSAFECELLSGAGVADQDRAVVRILELGGDGLSFTSLADSVSLQEDVLRVALDRLISSGRVVAKRKRGRVYYHVAEPRTLAPKAS